MPDKTLTYINNFDGNENISGSLTVHARPGAGVDRTGNDSQIRDSTRDFDADKELVVFDGAQVGGYAEFADERFNSTGGQPVNASATSFTMTANVDFIGVANQGPSGNGQVDGLSFNFGKTSSLPPAGNGTTTPRSGALEQGVSQGLAVRLIPITNTMQIAWNGTVIGTATKTNIESAPPSVLSVSVNESGLVSVSFAGTTLTGQIPADATGKPGLLAADQSDWGFSFAGRTGGNRGEAWVDDISLNARVVCFAAGTLIDTATGPKPVESLQAGDLVATRDHGLQPVRWTGSCTVDADKLARTPSLIPIKIQQDAIAPGMPHQDLLVSGQHRILVSSPIVSRMSGSDEVFVAAKHLLDLPGVSAAPLNGDVAYHHFLCDAHEIVRANGAWAESLLIAPQMYESLPWSAVTKIFQLFPQMNQRLESPEPARGSLKRKAAEKLVQRHLKNGKPLFEPMLTPEADAERTAG